VLLKGTTHGTATAADGSFTLQIPPDGFSTLLFSSVGYVSQDVAVDGNNALTIAMQVDSKELNEVVVTALGIEREKRALGYSVSTARPGRYCTA
jgi:hypothetical protein